MSEMPDKKRSLPKG